MFITNLVKIILLFFNVVRSSDISNDAYKQTLSVDRYLREIHKYNHPAEESIPVAIVFDDNGGREGKFIDNKIRKANTNKDTTNETNNTKDSNIIRENSDFSTETADSEKIQPQPGIKLTEQDQIPVAVIYEEEPTTVKTHEKNLRRSKIRNQSQLNRRQLSKVEHIVSKKKNNITNSEYITNTTEKNNEKEKLKTELGTDNTKVRHRSRERDPVVPIIQSENRVFGHSGDFRYSYEGGDGTQVFGTGELKSYEDDKKGEAVVGGFSYTDKNGQDFSLSYTADENGYRPVGAHLPTPPPIPPAIERALRYLATKTTPAPVTDSIIDSSEISN